MIDALTKGAHLAFAPPPSLLISRCRNSALVCAWLVRAVLVNLYEEPEKPQNAVEFIKMSLGAPTGTDVEALKAENEHLKLKVEGLEKELADAKAQLAAAPPAE